MSFLGDKNFRGTPGYENKFIFIDCQSLVKTNGATLIFIGELGNKKKLPGQFRPCLSFSASGMTLSPDFFSCGPKLRHLNCCKMPLFGDGVGR